MNKGLEALEKLYLQVNPNLTSEDRTLEYKSIIKKELKEKEKQGDYIEMLEDRIDNLETSYLRDRKALEIIKCLLFNKCKIYETSEKATATTITKGNYYVVELKLNNERFYIGKEEYVLLKEVLL